MPENINTLAVGHEDGSVKIWDLRAIGKIGKFKEENFFETVQSMCYSKSGRLLFAAYNTNMIKVWDMLTE
jgi:guanine nucleotide-binding protein G(I)/G(S)/G(T) subunit beta-1